MMFGRKGRTKAPATLAAIAVIVVATAGHRAYAQVKAEARSRTAGTTENKKITGATAARGIKNVRSGTRPRKTSAIPKPSVVLQPGEVPIIKFDSTVFEFGRVRAGTPVKHDFVFTNTGNGTLEILKAKAG